MESTLTAEASVSSDGKMVVFMAVAHGQTVQCAITRDALEEHFWTPIGAADARLLKAYMDGRKRIAAAVERKMLRDKRAPIVLHASDFTH